MIQPIGDFLKRQEKAFADATADWGKEEQERCLRRFQKFARRAKAVDAKYNELKDRLAKLGASPHYLDRVTADLERELLAEIKAFHVVMDQELMASFGIGGGVQ